MSLSYVTRLHTEAELQAIDEGMDSVQRRKTFLPLSTIAKQAHVIAAVNRCREVSPKDRWLELSRPSMLNRPETTEAEDWAASNLLSMMPGYCCLMDAYSIAGRL